MAPTFIRKLQDLPVPRSTIDQISELRRQRVVMGALAFPLPDEPGQYGARVWGPRCVFATLADALAATPPASFVWDPSHKPESRPTGKLPRPGPTRNAVKAVLAGANPHAAATKAGVNSSAVYRAISRMKRESCPHCGRAMK